LPAKALKPQQYSQPVSNYTLKTPTKTHPSPSQPHKANNTPTKPPLNRAKRVLTKTLPQQNNPLIRPHPKPPNKQPRLIRLLAKLINLGFVFFVDDVCLL